MASNFYEVLALFMGIMEGVISIPKLARVFISIGIWGTYIKIAKKRIGLSLLYELAYLVLLLRSRVVGYVIMGIKLGHLSKVRKVHSENEKHLICIVCVVLIFFPKIVYFILAELLIMESLADIKTNAISSGLRLSIVELSPGEYIKTKSTEFKRDEESNLKRTSSTQSIIAPLHIHINNQNFQRIVKKKRSMTIGCDVISEEALIISSLNIAIISITESLNVNYANALGMQLLSNYGGLRSLLSSMKNKATYRTLEQEVSDFFTVHNAPRRSKFLTSLQNCEYEYITRMTYIFNYKCTLLNISAHHKEYLGNTVVGDALLQIASCSLFHELINLVNGIHGNIEMIEDSVPSDMIQYYKNSILFSKVLTLRLRDIDDFTKISLKQFKPHISQFEIAEIFREFRDIIYNFAKLKQVEMSINHSKSPFFIITDKQRLLQILVNSAYTILENIDYGSISITPCKLKNNYVDIKMLIKTNERKKIISLFDSIKSYQTQQDSQTPIKNIEGISLVSSLLIANSLGKGIEFKRYATEFEIHVVIKDGFTNIHKGNLSGDSISAAQNTVENGRTAKFIKRKLGKLMKSSSSVNYLRKLCSTDKNNNIIDSPIAEAKRGDEIELNENVDEGLDVAQERRDNESNIRTHIASFKSKVDLNKLRLSSHECIKKKKFRRFTIDRGSRGSLTNACISNEDDSGFNAIIAEDNFVNSMVLKNLLRFYKMNALSTKDGRECVDEIKIMISKKVFYRIKIIFMDMQMPVMNGIDATKEIIRIIEEGSLQRVPIIGVSSDNSEEDRKKFISAGINEFVGKPVSKEILGKILTKYAGV